MSRVKGIVVRDACLPPWEKCRRGVPDGDRRLGTRPATAAARAQLRRMPGLTVTLTRGPATRRWRRLSSSSARQFPTPEGTKTEGTQQGQTEVAELSVNCDLCLGAAAAWRAFEERPTGRWRLGDGHGLVV